MDRFKEFNQGIQELQQRIRAAIPEDDCSPLPLDFQPRVDDVICGKGNIAWNHPGNVKFRLSLETNLSRYIKAASKYEKSLLVSEIVAAVHDDSGRFVKRDTQGHWYQVGHDAAREKTGQALRDLLLKQRKHSGHNQGAREKLNRRKGLDQRRVDCCKTVAAETADIGSYQNNFHCVRRPMTYNSSDNSVSNTTSESDDEDFNYEPLPLNGSFAARHSPEWMLEALEPLLH